MRLIPAVAYAFLIAPLSASATVLNFEDLPAGTTVTRQYARQGVIFNSAFLAADPAARSGTRVLQTVSPTAEVFTAIPLPMTFTRPQARVRLFASSPGAARKGTLRAFDASGKVVATDGPKLVAANRFTTMFEVSSATPRIARAELQLEGASHYAIDDLEFDTKPLTAAPRVVEMRQPSVSDNAAVTGRFPAGFQIGRPPEVAKRVRNVPPGEETEERVDLQFAPTLERDLAPGAKAEVSMKVTGRAGFSGSARWIGTAAALPVTLSLNGSPLATGRAYALGTNRGGADVGGTTSAAGEARLTVTNTSNVSVKVRLNLGVVRGQER